MRKQIPLKRFLALLWHPPSQWEAGSEYKELVAKIQSFDYF